jgi:hypothetical protein
MGTSSEGPPTVRSEETTEIPQEVTFATSVSTDWHLYTDVTPSQQPLTPKFTTTPAPYPVVTPVTEEMPSENVTLGEEVTPASNESSSEYPITFFLTTSPKTPEMITGTTTPTVSTSTDFTDRYPSSTEMPDCSVIPCHNGGTCIHTKEGPRVSYADTVTYCHYGKKLFPLSHASFFCTFYKCRLISTALTTNLLNLPSGHFVKNTQSQQKQSFPSFFFPLKKFTFIIMYILAIYYRNFRSRNPRIRP